MRFLIILLPLMLIAEVGTLIKIVDGDTLYFKSKGKKVKCRVQHIDTPESYQSTKLNKDLRNCRSVSKKEMIYAGKRASKHAKTLLKINREYLYQVNDKDHYGRSICVVKLKDTTFNEKMVLDGYAIPFRRYMNREDLNHFESLLQKAKDMKVGLWEKSPDEMRCLDVARG